jgi:hypothetical protein
MSAHICNGLSMPAKQIWLILVIMELSFCLASKAGIGDVESIKQQQIERQKEEQRMYDTDPPGIAHVIEYGFRDQRHLWNTNMAQNWWGIWVEDTNSGWRVNLCPVRSNTVDTATIIKVGSIMTNSGAGLLPTPDGKYAMLELLDPQGNTVPTKEGAAVALYEDKYAVMPVKREDRYLINNHPPDWDDTSVETNYPNSISDMEYPRWQYTDDWHSGWFVHFVGFVSNGPPCQIGFFKFDDIFSIKTKGNYTLMVQPVLYRMHYDGGTFQGYLDRVDLPCAKTGVHLLPNEK